jgi:hypothetical protein
VRRCRYAAQQTEETKHQKLGQLRVFILTVTLRRLIIERRAFCEWANVKFDNLGCSSECLHNERIFSQPSRRRTCHSLAMNRTSLWHHQAIHNALSTCKIIIISLKHANMVYWSPREPSMLPARTGGG